MLTRTGSRERIARALRRAGTVSVLAIASLLIALPVSAYADLPTVEISGIPEGVSPTDVTFTLNVIDWIPASEGTYYRLGPGGNGADYFYGNPDGAPVTISTEGTTVVEYWVDRGCCVDVCPHKYAVIRIHKDPPGPDAFPPVTITNAHATYTGSAVISFTGSDRGLGVAETYYRLDGGTQTPGTELTVTDTGAHSIEYWSVDIAGNSEDPHKTFNFVIEVPGAPDTTPPTTHADALATYVESANVTLSASDSGAGVMGTYYRLDGAGTMMGNSISVTALGPHVLEYWSADTVGNVEATNTAIFTIAARPAGSTDTTAPTTVSNAHNVYDGLANISLVATDSGGSGVAGTYYRLDGGGQLQGTSVEVATLGPHTLEFWSVDEAGNVETPHTTAYFTVEPVLVLDTSPPSTTSDAVASYSGSATVRLTAGDSGGSGVAGTYYRVDGGSQQTGGSISISTLGSHSIEFWSVDVAGNTETPHKTAFFTINPVSTDVTPPSTTSDAGASYAGKATIHLTGTDDPGGSGVANVYHSIDGGPQVTTAGGTATFVVTGVATHTVDFWSVDNAGNTETPHKTAVFTITEPPVPDNTAPSTSSDTTRSYVTSATIHLWAGDNADGWGVAHTYYILDGAAQSEGIVVTVGVGSHTLEFWSVDAADNVETPHKTASFTVTAPRQAPALSNPAAPAAMLRNRSYTVYATLKPRHAAGSYPVRIYKYRRLASGAWKSYGYVNARAATYGSYTRCAARVRLPLKGKWRLRAYAPADAAHSARWSSEYDYVTVK